MLKTIYSRKVDGMIDQCHSETDIVNYILPYIIVINFKIFYKKEFAPAGGIHDPLDTYEVYDILPVLLSFFRSVSEHAKTKFPHNVTCKTGHALAFGVTGRR